MTQLVSEFHERLKYAISMAVCDVPQTEVELRTLLQSYDEAQRYQLTIILWKEIQQLVEIVRDQK